MIARFITRTKTLRRQGRQFLIKTSTKAEHLSDKYQIIKKLLVIGTLTNLYFCYTSYVKISIYNEITKDIVDKFNQWNENQTKSKQMIFELMKQMDTIKTQKPISNINENLAHTKENTYLSKQLQVQQTKKSEGQKQNKKGSSFFGFFKDSKKENNKKDEYI